MSRSTVPLTKQISQLLAEHHVLSVPQLVDFLSKNDNRYNKTSVYRALEKLVEQNEVCKVNFGDNNILYELHNDEHDHAVCTVCGKVLTTPYVELPPLTVENFTADHHHLTYFGICSECKQKTNL